MFPLGLASNLIVPPIFKFWKLFAIVILLGAIGFGGWYYSSKMTNLNLKVGTLNSALFMEQSNNKQLNNKIYDITSNLDDLLDSNIELENDVKSSKNELKNLQDNPKIIYIKQPPAECEAKLNWLKTETLKLKERIK